ncbi:MAG: hypothetical protein C5B59_06260 [Bacteroidetes bacterium]|nr:MAG: hypothetical protein C5B59_06260 [Bacteroidota bacterium]
MDTELQTWLQNLNAEFRRNDVPPKQRPWIAWQEWATHSGESLSLNDDVVKEIFNWFEKHSKAGLQYIQPLYVGAYYYDSTFWPVVIPVVFGRVQLDARESLKTMPDAVASGVFRDRNELMDFMSFWANCLDYGFGIEGTQSAALNEFAKRLLSSADQRLTATVSLLLQNQPNSSCLESSRMATEMFLKAYLAVHSGLTENDAKRIGHDLNEALSRCVTATPSSELRTLVNDLNVFPDVGHRYQGSEEPQGILWKAYETAQYVGATVCRSFTGRDVRNSMRIR